MVYNQNVLINTSASTSQSIVDEVLKSRYPPVTTVAADWNAVGFQKGSYKLATTSRFYRAGDDGKDLGVDVDALTRAQEGPASGGCQPMGISAQAQNLRQ